MNNARLLMTLTLFLFLILLLDNAVAKVRNNTKNNNKESVLSEKTTPSPAATPTITPTITPSFTPAPASQTTSVNTSTPIPQQPVVFDQSFVYPGAQKIGDNMYEHSDNPQVITNWYKQKIKERNMNTTSFITTSVNENVLNKLAASNGQTSLEVEIDNKNTAKTTITLRITTR